MANEAVLREWQEDPIDFIVSDTAGIEKGTVLKLIDERRAEASASNDSSVAPAGIAHREKIANDGRTRLAVYRKGIFDMYQLSGSNITTGDQVKISGVNLIVAYLKDGTEDHLALGKSLGTNTAANQELIQIAVNI